MKRICVMVSLLLGIGMAEAAPSKVVEVASPNKSIKLKFTVDKGGVPTYLVFCNDSLVVKESKLGLVMGEADLSKGLSIAKVGKVEKITDSYTLLNDKRSRCTYSANRCVVAFGAKQSIKPSIIFQVSNDGVAFRYLLEGAQKGVKHIVKENTSFCFPTSAKGWLHPHAEAQTGWSNTQPSYEEYYKMNIPVGTPSELKQGWSFPALFQSAGHWVLITETDMSRSYCGSHLGNPTPNGEYSIAFAQEKERTSAAAPLLPESTLPWTSPWRVIEVGKSLSTIVESTLPTDLSSPAKKIDYSFVQPGKSSWSWVLLNDGATTYDVQKQFIDYASQMGWRYCLVDALWDTQIGYDKIAELAAYAKGKNVGLLLWYNSNGSWNKAPQTPLNRIYDAATRRMEFERISKMGIKGVKIDFFGGDGQSFMAYYQDILDDAAKAGLVVNFHGATIPRGWTRTYPNLVSMESVRGFEYLTFDQNNTNEEPTHCAVLPFTRNAIGPMDFTPVCFSEIPGKKRISSNGFEIALSVIFQSGVQHYAEIPSGMNSQPSYVVDFMRNLPLRWDDVKLIDGFPGEYAVVARRAGSSWYVGGINGTSADKHLTLDLSVLGNVKGGTVIADGESARAFTTYELKGSKLDITVKPRGGFVVKLY
ncbi:glycoside hydrolase family 97 catalytic domain-containing protein [uncultured Acetobacteroides sp.]|uniref:glycoside hydrolase family 97 protein n=1 Tax=uncultured Acetobacteroides sp. TaxID=1760811 RepID=UPI0029F541C6|nr:glycoside hydrolase family 97 catalytic domain-containing protein [uncultured Acetobacteroides sp.]